MQLARVETSCKNLIQVKEPLKSLGLSYSECSLSFLKARLQAPRETDGWKAGISRQAQIPFSSWCSQNIQSDRNMLSREKERELFWVQGHEYHLRDGGLGW